MHAWAVQTFNSIAFAGLLFLLASGFTLIFGLMKIPNMAHGACFMLGAYVGYSVIQSGLPFFVAVAARLYDGRGCERRSRAGLQLC